MKISPVDLIKKTPFVLAPMDDVTDVCFRKLCEENGCAYSTTELTSIEALIRDKVHPSRYEKKDLKINCIQLFGNNPKSFVKAAKKVYDQADFFDVNFGCPSATVTGNDCGSMLLKDPKNVYEIISSLVKEIDKPITAKIRLGYEKMNHIEIAKEIERAGATLITVHGRTAKQKYSGRANWDAIKEIYENINIPLIGNGDISSEDDIDKYLGSHCNALMIGRAAIGNPTIFKKFNHYLKNKEKLEIKDPKSEQKKQFIKYIDKIEKTNQYNKDIKIKRQSAWFLKGLVGAREFRGKIQQIKDPKEIIKLVKEF